MTRPSLIRTLAALTLAAAAGGLRRRSEHGGATRRSPPRRAGPDRQPTPTTRCRHPRASSQRACAGSGRVDTTRTPTTRASRGRAAASWRKFTGRRWRAALMITRHARRSSRRWSTDAPRRRSPPRPGQATYMLASGLAAGVHTVELYRQTEGPQGESQLDGLTVGRRRADAIRPPAPSRLIEVIGDSITCGYGILGTLADTDCYPTESHWDTYEAVAGARARRRGQHHRRVGPRHHPQLRRRHDRHACR